MAYARTLTAEEQDLSITQSNNPDSASQAVVRMVTDDGEFVAEGVQPSADQLVVALQVNAQASARMVSDHGTVLQQAAPAMLPAVAGGAAYSSEAGSEQRVAKQRKLSAVVQDARGPNQLRCSTVGTTGRKSALVLKREAALMKLAEKAAAAQIAGTMVIGPAGHVGSMDVHVLMLGVLTSVL